jgi:LL-diaminopimelate aminotransferase
MTKIIPILKDCGFKVECPKAGFYLYIRSPKFVKYLGSTYEFYNAEEFAQWMVKELGIVVVPYDDVENCIRLSMTFGVKGVTDDEIINVFRERMMGASFIFVN